MIDEKYAVQITEKALPDMKIIVGFETENYYGFTLEPKDSSFDGGLANSCSYVVDKKDGKNFWISVFQLYKTDNVLRHLDI